MKTVTEHLRARLFQEAKNAVGSLPEDLKQLIDDETDWFFERARMLRRIIGWQAFTHLSEAIPLCLQ